MIWKKDTMEVFSLPRCTPVSSSEETGEAFLVRQHSHHPWKKPGRVKGKEWLFSSPLSLACGRFESHGRPHQPGKPARGRGRRVRRNK